MKTLRRISSIVLGLTLLTTGCQTESIPQNCEGDNAPYLSTFYSDEFKDISCGLQNVDGEKKQVNLIITNQSDFEKFIFCSIQPPVIDFEKYFVLTGVYRHHQCARFDSQQILICNNKVIYKVRMQEEICQAAIPVFYIIAIEKKYSNLDIEFDVQFKN